MLNKLRDQHHLLLEQKYIVLQAVDDAGKHLDNKAMGLLQSAGLIIAITSAVAIPLAFSGDPSSLAKAGLAFAGFTFILMIITTMRAWSPSQSIWPGSLDWDEMYDTVILKDVENSYAQVLRECTNSISKNQKRNAQKARLVKIAAVLFIVQIVGLLFVALVA